MPALAPPKANPLPVTVLLFPTFFVSNVAVPPVSVTTSPVMIPLPRVRVRIVAAVVPSYSLLAAVKLPVSCLAVMFAVVVSVDEARL